MTTTEIRTYAAEVLADANNYAHLYTTTGNDKYGRLAAINYSIVRDCETALNN